MLSPGMRIGKYEVLEPIGAGGMGEVWKARDTTLQREVAIKTLPDAFASDPERVARLEREAKLLASLNHPNIASIHGLEKSDGTSFLELELVEGQTLAERLEAGPAPLETALKIALEIAEALEAAHAKGVVHRDLKPGNVMLTPQGGVKVLDFGLAKTFSAGSGDAPQRLDATASMTRAGVLLGTPPYMSPEQVRGGPVDAQTDIWAFGCILFEMLTGWSPFERASSTETLGRILEREPELEALPAETPALVRRLIGRCLQKDPRDRLHHIGDARIEIREALGSATSHPADAKLGPERFAGRRWVWAGGITALVAIAVSTASFVGLRPGRDSSPEPALYALGTPVRAPIVSGGDRIVAISPDGARVAYDSASGVWLQTPGRQDAISLAGGASANPFFSSDSEWVAFEGSDGSLKKASVFDRVPITVTSAAKGRFLGGTWYGNTIVFATQMGMYRVSADREGVEATLLLQAPGDRIYAWPQFLPDGKSVLLTVLSGNSIAYAYVALLDLETGRLSDPLVRGAVSARYVAGSKRSGGHLVYATEGNRLAARAFDPETRQVGAAPVDIPGVEVRVAGSYLSAAFDISDTGTLVHIRPPPRAGNRLLWVDHEGNEQVLDATPPGPVGYPRVSPEGDRVAFDVGGGTPDRRVWTMDLVGGVPVQLSNTGNAGAPYEDFGAQWSRDGKRVYFGSLRTDDFQIWWHAADGSGGDERLVDNPDVHVPLASTPDGRLVVMGGLYPVADIGLLDPDDPSAVKWLTKTPFSEVTPSLSPDGRWMAYASNELGDRYEIYVQSFPSGQVKKRVSRNGGAYPLWGLAGSGELYYFGLDDSGKPAMMAATLELSPALKLVGERALFRNEAYRRWTQAEGLRPYDISPKDGRFLIPQTDPMAGGDQMTIWVSLNWTDAL